MAFFGNLMNNYFYGKSGKGDYRVEDMPQNRRQLFGAVLDVFEEEPLPRSSPLWDMEQVILTPHNSFVGEHNGERLFRLICKNLESFAQ